MTGALAEQYQALEESLLRRALELVRAGDVGVLSAWFSVVRFRPASAFRNERVDYVSKKGRGEIHWALPTVISQPEPWLPKEIELVEIIRSNTGHGRKTLTFYFEQTGTRDIRDCLKEVLESLAPGGGMTLVEVPKVGLLSAGDMSSARQEAWIKLATPKMDTCWSTPSWLRRVLTL